MRNVTYYLFLSVVFYCASGTSYCQSKSSITSIQYDVSMDKPHTHYIHVKMICEVNAQGTWVFKLPAWTPGYYWLVNYARNVISFQAEDGNKKALAWHKLDKNSWEVSVNDARQVVITYDVYAFTQSVAEPFLDDRHAYIAPAGIFMYVDGHLDQPSTVTFHPFSAWQHIATGLDPVAGKPNTFEAPNVDVLYDSPMLLGNQEVLSFTVQGIRHDVVLEEPAKFDKQRFVSDVKRMVETASSVMGEFPYKHYTFLIMGEGRGGLEHLNSTAVFSSGTVYNNGDEAGYKRWLNFLTHEYFHLYNIKAIRPIALGPFDYDRENYTNMLWVSEGFTVYYEYLILNRAGILSGKEVLDFLHDNIAACERGSGKQFQSATQSSFDTWLNFFNHNEHTANTTISYYDKGAVLAMLLDLKIRKETGCKKSLDDVMRTLYGTYYKEKKRGFTDQEFQQVCEAVAGTSLAEIFRYANTVEKIDYQKYLDHAGLQLDDAATKISGSYLGASFQEKEGTLTITAIDFNSPASFAGLSSNDVVVSVDGEPTSARRLAGILSGKTAGDTLRVAYRRNETKYTTPVVLTSGVRQTFELNILLKPSASQALLRRDWLKD